MGITTFILIIFVVPSMGQNLYSNMISLDNGNYNVSWSFNASLDTLEFLVEVRGTGWIGFGFALNAPNNMTYYDVAVGGVFENGTAYLQVQQQKLTVTICRTALCQFVKTFLILALFLFLFLHFFSSIF